MYHIPDHPEIESIMRTGYPTWMQDDFEDEDEEYDEEEAYYDWCDLQGDLAREERLFGDF